MKSTSSSMKASAKARNKRIAGVYFKSTADLRAARKAARKLGLTFTAYLRDSVARRTTQVLAI